jgi:hypothetical protein
MKIKVFLRNKKRKFKVKKDKIKRHFKKIYVNYDYKRRYNNSLKKIELLNDEVIRLNKELDKDEQEIKIRNLKKFNSMILKQRNELRKEFENDKNS